MTECRRHDDRAAKSSTKAVRAAADALDEALYHFGECQRLYHDPGRFLFALNALIQAARNVTFRLQAHKSEIPAFDEWYGRRDADGLWQAYLRAQPHAKWAVETRNLVVKKGALAAASRARVTLICSYLDSEPRELDLQPSTSTSAVIATAIRGVPVEALGNSVVQVERRWEADSLGGHEVLEVMADCLHMLMALVADGFRRCKDPSLRQPEVLVTALPRDASLFWTPSQRLLLIDPVTGRQRIEAQREVRLGPSEVRKAMKKYPFTDAFRQTIDENDPIEVARKLVPHVRMVAERGKGHVSILFLHHPSGRWVPRPFVAHDRADKYLHWRRVADDVEAEGHDALIYVSEVWSAPFDSVDLSKTPYPDLSTHPKREELLVVWAESEDGRAIEIAMPISRRFGRYKVGTAEERTPQGVRFTEPVLAVWRRRRARRAAE